MNTYDVNKPRFEIRNPDCTRSFETLSWNEARFWHAMGYLVTICRWDGTSFVPTQEKLA